ncbi:hypothetical protein C7212DRAFT_357014 [Tuber magnatum]|uniref:Uncharacterized protein n=1 Tax=Tuber magnatum TaxID=42249 RepID=A0A317SVI4_9PEZI|nr:hypothetical protein C7212DRAFT_357014 [Tuber magnatum]
MPDPGTLFELEDAQRKVATSNALLAYREACAETLVIEADEEQRRIRVQLIILEARYEKLYQEYSEDKDYLEQVEPALKEAYVALRWHEDAVARYKVKNKELREKHKRNLVGEQKQQEAEVAALRASLEEALGAKEALQERILQLEDELLRAAAKESAVDADLSKHKRDLEAYKRSTNALKAQSTEWEEKHRGSIVELRSLQEDISTLRLDLQKRQQITAAENQSLQQEVTTLRLELEKTQAALKKASESAATEIEKDGKRKSQEVADLKAALRKEAKAREKAEKDLAKSKEDWQAKHEVLESKLESTRSKLVALKSSSASAPAPAPAPASTAVIAGTSSAATSIGAKLPAQNPKKRASTLTMEDLELSAKRPRKTPPKTSEFSITPFLRRQAAAADTSVANATTVLATTTAAAVASEADVPEAPEVGETTLIPALIESKEPTKILLAGANRKRKAKTTPAKPDIPEATAAEETVKPKPKPRKRKPAAAKTLFTEDDGSGRLTLAPLAESQELPALQMTATAAAVGGKKGKKAGGGDLAGVLAGSASLFVPSVSAFNSEFSPSKKRPEGLKKLFGGKK